MPQIRNALEVLETLAPRRFAFSFDRVGLQVGDPAAKLTRGVVALDRSLGAVRFATEHGAQMLIAHHPLIFEPVATVLQTSHVGRTILELARNGIAFAAAHTNWDSAKGGINDALACRLALVDVKDFGSAAMVRTLKLVVFSPSESFEKIIDAASEAGAGVIGEYSRCAFTHPGIGTFLGSENSDPVVGEPGKVAHADETRIEMVVPESRAKAVERAIRRVHPYEEPAFDFFVLADREEQPAGRIGSLTAPMSLREVALHANQSLGSASWVWGDPGKVVKKLAVVGGAADSDWRKAREAGADAMLTGEVKQHVGLEAAEEGFALLASGHYETEHPGCEVLRDRLEAALPEVEWLVFVPEAGFAGRSFH